jgi:hypothetical protein
MASPHCTCMTFQDPSLSGLTSLCLHIIPGSLPTRPHLPALARYSRIHIYVAFRYACTVFEDLHLGGLTSLHLRGIPESTSTKHFAIPAQYSRIHTYTASPHCTCMAFQDPSLGGLISLHRYSIPGSICHGYRFSYWNKSASDHQFSP